MRVAILSDIHGNAVALETVLKEIKLLDIEYLFILGDIVGYYYHADKVMDLLEEWPKKVIIQGNHEVLLKNAIECPDVANKIRARYGSGIEIAQRTLTSDQIKMITTLPFVKKFQINSLQFLLSHGSPWDLNTYIYPDSELEILEKCMIPGIDYVFLGHTHYPFIFQRDGISVVNVGSVGQARDWGGVASWVVLDTVNRVLVFKKTPYNMADLVAEVKEIDPHCSYLWEVLLRGSGHLL